MNHAKSAVTALLAGLLLLSAARAQTTNPPATLIEMVELQPDAVIIKGFGSVGSVNIGQGVMSVEVKETSIADRKWYGLALEYAENDHRERAVLDYEEIQPLVKGMDYIGTVTYNVTTLTGFQAVFQTKAGFKITGLGIQRQNGIQPFLQFDGFPRIPVDAGQLSQLRNIIAQGLIALDSLKPPK
jgi:hypothetical protein